MSETPRSVSGNPPDASHPHDARPKALLVLAVALFLEAAVMTAILVWLGFELLTEAPRSLASALALIVLAAAATAFLLGTAVGALRRRAWIRAAAVTWQFVQIAVAIGAFQGAYSRPDVGWLILVPSIVVLGLLFTPAVTTALRRD